jgi:glycine/D-amino acid oxidase-like deaminating enzyme
LKKHLTLAAILFLAFGFLTGCEDDGETLIIDGIDCGLERIELVGNWTVGFDTAARTLVSCTGPNASLVAATEGTPVSSGGAAVLYTGTDVLGNDASPSFQVTADASGGGDAAIDPEFVMNIGADSCQAFFRVWEEDDNLFIQCIGTFDRSTGLLSTFCDSAEVDADDDDVLDVTCSLNDTIGVDLSVN